MNATAAKIHAAAQSPDPVAALADVRRHVAGLKVLELTVPDALVILDSSATLALKLGLIAEAAALEEAVDALESGGIIPTSRYFGWLSEAAPASKATPVSEPEKATQPTGPLEVVVLASPMRVTRTVVVRNKANQIVETTQVSQDVL